ncbi:hypothetical protein K488DRAFT_52142 [Vararia minispora EC-137]|uniref:Uncharacterized protein n=1 Tax=Vararia minispora EC-137 TaxID=1314806 RepID=A0ACB8QI98_9AGAM|nr:hypothetical protein K488DRAFT_52142 [Vararia minispora EC-137]
MPDASRARYSFATISPPASFDSRRPTRPTRENQWVEKHGRKHHGYAAAKAPYPLSYDKDILDRDAIDLCLRLSVMTTPTAVHVDQPPPERALDLGCGTGAWIINTARKYWKETEFVGFDLVNIQIPTAYLESQLASRISWQHGNFLSQRLPFDDNSFDFVRIMSIARGVPENKWISLFQEVNRVLAPNGVVEVTEEDITFPIIPRWFSEPLRSKPRTRASSKASTTPVNGFEPETAPPSPPNSPPHDHTFLELLFVSLHESRFINMKPTNTLAVYFTPFFSRCMHGPTLHFGMPFLSPLRPLPTARQSSDLPDISSRVESTIFTRPPSVAYPPPFSATSESKRSSSVAESDLSARFPSFADDSITPTLMTPEPSPRDRDDDNIWRNWNFPGPKAGGGTWAAPLPEDISDPNMLPGPPLRGLDKLSSRTRAVILWQAYLGVRGCQEAMWEELLLLQETRAGRERLREVGWTPSKPWEAEDRSRFEELFDIYERDIRARTAFWYSSTELGLPLPRREPLPKADLAEEERRRKAILDSRALLAKDDTDVPVKTTRVFAGYKMVEGEEASAQNTLTSINGGHSISDNM